MLRYQVCDGEREETFLNCFSFLLKSSQIWGERLGAASPIGGLMLLCFMKIVGPDTRNFTHRELNISSWHK